MTLYGTSRRETYVQRGNKVDLVTQTTTPNAKCLVAHWADGKEGEQARSECEARPPGIGAFHNHHRDSVCTQR